MKYLLIVLIFSSAAFAGNVQTFTGEISDSQCATKVHSRDGSHTEMFKASHMGATPAQCARSCVHDFGGHYVLLHPSSGTVYRLDNQTEADKFAGEHVTVRGVLEKDMIRVIAIGKSRAPIATRRKPAQ